MKSRLAWLTGLLAVLLYLAGCSRGSSESPPSEPPPARPSGPKMAPGGAKPAAPASTVSEQSEGEPEMVRFGDGLRKHLMSGEYEALDKTADELKKSNARLPGGAWWIGKFYWNLASSGKEGDEAGLMAMIEKEKEWTEKRPDSVAAWIALAQAYREWAWMARGTGLARDVSPENFQIFGERLELAAEALAHARSISTHDPHLYYLGQVLAKDTGSDREAYDKIFEECFALYPEYYYCSQQKAVYLSPKWHGEPGDTARFMTEIADRVGGAKGDILYFEIAVGEAPYLARNPVKDLGLDWERIKRGYAENAKANGNHNWYPNQLARCACLVGDQPTARALFEQIGLHWDSDVWKTRDHFEKYRNWALGVSQ